MDVIEKLIAGHRSIRERCAADKNEVINELEQEHVILREKIGAFAALARGVDCSSQTLTRKEIVKFSGEILDIFLPHTAAAKTMSSLP